MESNLDLLFNQLNEIVENLDKKQKKLRKAVIDFKKKGGDSDPFATRLWMKSNKDLIEEETPETHTMIEQVEDICKDIMLKFESDLRDAISKEPWDLSGQWPKYYVDHVIPIVIDDKKYSVSVGEDNFKSLHMRNIIGSLKTQLRFLRPKPEQLSEFLRDMYVEYKKLARSEKPSVSVSDLYAAVVIRKQPAKLWRDASRSKFRSFRKLEFHSYLTELLKSGKTSIFGQQIRLLPPISQKDSIYIYQPAENRFCNVGRIEFISTGDRNEEPF